MLRDPGRLVRDVVASGKHSDVVVRGGRRWVREVQHSGEYFGSYMQSDGIQRS